MDVRACLFDVFGTVVDWRTSVSREFAAFAQAKGITGVDPVEFAIEKLERDGKPAASEFLDTLEKTTRARAFIFDRSGNEADDKCAWSPTPFIGTGGYGYQYEWSNANSGCVKTR